MNIRELVTKWGFDIEHDKLDRVEGQLEGIKHRLEFLGAVEVIKGIYELTERFSQFAESLHVASTAAGLTVEEFQKLSFAAGQNAVSQDEMGTAMARLGRHLYDARKGSAEAQKAFALAGFSGTQIAGFHTTRDAMLALSDRFRQIQDPIKKQAIAMELMGRGSINMVQFLSKGSGAIRQLGNEAEKLGVILSGEQVEALVEVEHSMQKLWAVIKNIGATIAVYLAPILNTGIGLFLKFYETNKKVIDVNIKGWAEDLAYVLGYLHGLVQGIIEAFLNFASTHQLLMRRVFELFLALTTLALGVTAVSRAISLVKGIFESLSVVMTPIQFLWEKAFGPAIFWVGGLVKQALTTLFLSLAELTEAALPALSEAFLAVGAAMEATPVGWIITGIAALVVVIHDLWTILTGGKWEDTWLGKGFNMLKGFGNKALSFLGLGGSSEDQAAGAEGAANRSTASTGFNALQNLGGITGGPLPGASDFTSSDIAAATAVQPGQGAISISAPLTIQAAQGMNEKELAKYATDSHKEHLSRTIREASRSLTPVLAQ